MWVAALECSPGVDTASSRLLERSGQVAAAAIIVSGVLTERVIAEQNPQGRSSGIWIQ
jgi:hypothetical protein